MNQALIILSILAIIFIGLYFNVRKDSTVTYDPAVINPASIVVPQ